MSIHEIQQIAETARYFLDTGDVSAARTELEKLDAFPPLPPAPVSPAAHELRQLRDQNARLEADMERMVGHLHDAVQSERAAWEQHVHDVDSWNTRMEAELRAMILEILDHPPGLSKLDGDEFWAAAGKAHHVTVRHARWPEAGLSPASVLDRLRVAVL